MGAGVDDFIQDRTLRIGQDHFNMRCHTLKKSPHAGDGSARTHARDNGIELMFHLLPNFRRGPFLVRRRIGRVGKLIDKECTLTARLHFARDTLRHVLVILRMSFGNIRARHHNVDAHRAQVKYFFLTHLVRDYQQ